MINAAIVGLGWWGQNHVTATKGSDKIRFTRAIDLAPDNVRGFCDENGLALTDRIEDAYEDPDIDAIVLVTPHTQHADQVVAGAKAGKHILTEKPFALKKADGERAAKAMQDAGLTLGIGHNYRYGAAVWEMKKIIDAGKLGEVHHIEGNLSHQGQLGVEGWRRSREEAPTGGIVHFGAHIIDIMCWYGGPMREVYAQLESRIIENDVGSVLTKFESGATGYLGNLMTTPASFHLQVMGSEGWARANGWMDTNRLVTCFGAGKPEESGGHTEEIELEYRDIFTQLRANDENFAAACLGEEDYLFTPEEMVHTAAIHEAIAKSAERGQPTAV
ncbi:MAG: Gfo/Idh/MocA family oxidoreductase [Alphaproteobacteria bacterium]|nr:Gfo/Idh/MocA family oxidoreductase [Alphaproteobacteria bacterium]